MNDNPYSENGPEPGPEPGLGPEPEMAIQPEPEAELSRESRQVATCLAVANRVVELSVEGTFDKWDPEPNEPATRAMRQVYGQGGLDAVDVFLQKVNACLAVLGARYSFFPGAATEGRSDRDSEFLVITSRDLRKNTQLSYHWFQLDDRS